MNKEDECKIIEDLLYGYSESILNIESSNFVKEHLKTCDSCKNKFETIEHSIVNEKTINDKKDEIEISHLLKINKIINTLKISLTISIILLILFLFITIFNSNKTDYIVKNAYNKLNELEQLNNYKLTKKEIYLSHNDDNIDSTITEIYYMNGKYKQTLQNSISFYEDNSNKTTYVFTDLNSIEEHYTPITYKGETFKEDSGIKYIYDNAKNIFQKASYKISSNIFNGIDCYVIKIEINRNEYREFWVNKENFVTVRIIENFADYYREYIYDVLINTVSDSDVTLDFNKYKNYSITRLN